MRILHRTPVILAALAISGLNGCASSDPEQTPSTHTNVYIGDEPLFAVLVRRSNGQWTFDEIRADNREPDDGFLVRLNDLAPVFDTRPAECEPRPYRENDRCNPLNPFRKKDMGVVGKIVDTGISAGTGGKITNIGRSYVTDFDKLAFNAAVDQALLASGMDDGRIHFIDGISRIAEKVAEHNAAVAATASKLIAEYERDKRDNIAFELRISGLRQYYSNDLDPADFVKVESNSPSWSRQTADDQVREMLPCDASRCIAELNETLRNLDQAHSKRLAELHDRLLLQTNEYRIDCSVEEFNGYHFELECPETLRRIPGDVAVLPIEMNILSRDFPALFPAFAEQDNSLSARIHDGDLVLENLTDEFIDIQSVSLYYNSQINTVMDKNSQLDLAPRQTRNRSLSQFSSEKIDIESKQASMTPDKASRSSFSFGLAVKYSLNDRNTIETIYAVNDFQVDCAIDGRLGRNGCDDNGKAAVAQ